MTKSIQVDAEVLEITKKRGKDQPHLLDIGSPEARHTRSHDLTLMFQEDSIRALKEIPKVAALVVAIKKDIVTLQETKFYKAEEKYNTILRTILNRKIWIYSKILKKKKVLLQEYKEQMLDFAFIDDMIGVRRRDEQVISDTHDDVGEVLIKTTLRSGAKEKHDEIAKKRTKSTQKNLEDFNKKPRPKKKVTTKKKQTQPKKKKDKTEGFT